MVHQPWEVRGFYFNRLRSGPFEGPAIVIPPALPEDHYFCKSFRHFFMETFTIESDRGSGVGALPGSVLRGYGRCRADQGAANPYDFPLHRYRCLETGTEGGGAVPGDSAIRKRFSVHYSRPFSHQSWRTAHTATLAMKFRWRRGKTANRSLWPAVSARASSRFVLFRLPCTRPRSPGFVRCRAG